MAYNIREILGADDFVYSHRIVNTTIKMVLSVTSYIIIRALSMVKQFAVLGNPKKISRRSRGKIWYNKQFERGKIII